MGVVEWGDANVNRFVNGAFGRDPGGFEWSVASPWHPEVKERLLLVMQSEEIESLTVLRKLMVSC
jgi:hypothetical protein